MHNEAVKFRNWTNKEFVGRYGGVDERIAPGASKYFVRYEAEHYAHQLAVEILNFREKPTVGVEHDKLVKRCLEDIVFTEDKKIGSTLLNLNSETVPEASPVKTAWCDSCDSKGVRHKKVCPKYNAAPLQTAA